MEELNVDEIAERVANETVDEDDVAVEGLKTKLIRTVKAQAAGELQNTDWYIVRKADASTAVPSTITTHPEDYAQAEEAYTDGVADRELGV